MPLVLTGEQVAFDAIGTRWRLTTDRPIDAGLRDRVDDLIERYDRTWSRFRADSAVQGLAATGGPRDLGPEAAPLLGLLEVLRTATDGAMDPLVAASLEHLGYDAGVGLAARPGHLPAPRAVVTTGVDGVRLDPPALLDVGSAGKGQLVDLVAGLLARAGHERFVVDASGDLVAAGAPLTVALEHPFDPSAAVGVIEVDGGAIAGSAVNRRAWTGPDGRRLHHVLDARTGAPVETVAATWVLAGSAMLADALATALFLVPPEALADRFDFRWVRITTDGRLAASDGIPGELFR